MSDPVDSEDSNAGEPGRGSSSLHRRRRVKLSDLPYEIKDLIMRHCHGADHDIDCIIQSLVNAAACPLIPTTICSSGAGPPWRRSTKSRSSGGPCALRTGSRNSRLRKSPTTFFHLVIAPKYGHHFIDVDFTATTSTQIVEFAKALPLLPNLHTIDITNDLIDATQGLDALLKRAVEEKLVLAVAKGVRRLSLDCLPVDEVFRFTAGARNVTCLSLESPVRSY
ncbi:hypothetical protein JCM8115_006017 [Rhodotorula mucilaginosa]